MNGGGGIGTVGVIVIAVVIPWLIDVISLRFPSAHAIAPLLAMTGRSLANPRSRRMIAEATDRASSGGS